MNSIIRDILRPFTESIRQAGDEYMVSHVDPSPSAELAERKQRIHEKALAEESAYRKRQGDRMYREREWRAARARRYGYEPPGTLSMFLELFSAPFKLFRKNNA